MTTLPPLKPNDYLFEKYADKGKSKAEIFAWVARDVMAKVAKVKKFDLDVVWQTRADGQDAL